MISRQATASPKQHLFLGPKAIEVGLETTTGLLQVAAGLVQGKRQPAESIRKRLGGIAIRSRRLPVNPCDLAASKQEGRSLVFAKGRNLEAPANCADRVRAGRDQY
jgi:hypothetical protein